MKISVIGHYFHANLGDELFIDSFKKLFPSIELDFHDITGIQLKDIESSDGVFIGGGSFLDQDPKFPQNVIELIKSKPYFYIGVGCETEIHPIHRDLIQNSKGVFARTPSHIHKLTALNSNAHAIPDIVYSLTQSVISSRSRSVLIMPNITVVPYWDSPHWMHASWNYFKSEFSQFIDHLSINNYKINFFSMCQSSQLSDTYAAYEIIGAVKDRRNCSVIKQNDMDFDTVLSVIASHDVVITSRFHGIILAEMTKTPYISIAHHDKLYDSSAKNGTSLSYYNTSKSALIHNFNNVNRMFLHSVDLNPFKDMVNNILNILELPCQDSSELRTIR